jgi:proline dehydrogenase
LLLCYVFSGLNFFSAEGGSAVPLIFLKITWWKNHSKGGFMKTLDTLLSWFGNHWPGKYFVSRFVAGEEMEDALKVAKVLNEQGFEAIVNFLGEEVKERSQVQENARIYLDLLKKIHFGKLKARVSIKPSQLGLKIDPRIYWHQMVSIGRDAYIYQIPLEIDMETEDTVVETINETVGLAEYYPGLNLRQAMAMNFKESFTHLYNLTAAGVKVRLCKGAYSSKYSEKKVAERYFSAASYLFRQKANPDFATHDLRLLEKIFRLRNEYPAACGFQFLLGLRKKTWKELATRGERVGIYAPFGTNWLPYAKRRWKYLLKKLPSIILGN